MEKPTLTLEDGRPVIRALIELVGDTSGKTVEMVPAVVTPEGVESGDEDGTGPQPLNWQAERTGRTIEGRYLSNMEDGENRWVIRVAPVRDTVTRVSIRLVDAEP